MSAGQSLVFITTAAALRMKSIACQRPEHELYQHVGSVYVTA